MIAEVLPVKRLPRSMRGFDYEIPRTLEATVKRGSFVMTMLRNETCLGVVVRIKDHPFREVKLKEIDSVIHDSQLTQQELSFFEWLSEELAQSVSTLLYTFLPDVPQQKQQAQKNDFEKIAFTLSRSETSSLLGQASLLCERRKAFVYSADLKRSAALISFFAREKADQKIVVLVPNVQDAKKMAMALSFLSPLLWTGEDGIKKRFYTWKRFQSMDQGLLIGTKSALLSIASNTTTIFVVKQQHEHHGQHEQNPYFDVRLVAERYADLHQLNFFALDRSMSTDALSHFPPTHQIGHPTSVPPIQWIDKRVESLTPSQLHLLPYRTEMMIQQYLESGKRVLIAYNKTQKSQYIECSSCHTIMRCLSCKNVLSEEALVMRCVRCKQAEPKLLSCPLCKQSLFTTKGISNNSLAQDLASQFPHTKICLVDKEHPDIDPLSQVILATSIYPETIFHPFSQETFGCVILLDADAPLFYPSIRATDRAMYQLETWRSIAQIHQADYYVQSGSVSLFDDMYANPHLFLAKELDERTAYQQPPFWHKACLWLPKEELRKTEILTNALIQKIRKSVPGVQLLGVAQDDKKGKRLDVLFLPSDRQEILKLFKQLPDSIRIDTQADLL